MGTTIIDTTDIAAAKVRRREILQYNRARSSFDSDEHRNHLSFLAFSIAATRIWQRYWPFTHGGGILARLVKACGVRGWIKPDWCKIGLFEYWTDLSDWNAREIAINPNIYGAVVDASLSRLPLGGVVIDIGANRGVITLNAARHVGTTGRVLAVEPNPDVSAILKRNIRRNAILNVTVFDLACSESEGQALFFTNADHSGLSSLSEQNANTSISVQVSCRTVDSIVARTHLERCDLVKIDVEGAELKVLDGMRDTIRTLRPAVVIEIAPDLLASFGTTEAQIDNFFEDFAYTRQAIDVTNVLFYPME